MTDNFPAAPKHLPLKECFPGVYFLTSHQSMAIPLKLQLKFSRNMVAVLEDDGWVLLNPVRVSAETEAEMLKKAPFKHAVRIGSLHGQDDAYYVEKHGARFWAVPGKQTAYPKPAIEGEISEDGEFPIRGAQILVFKQSKLPECVVCLPQHQLLVTCDSMQNYTDDPMLTTFSKLVMRPMGFFTPCVIGPIWLKMVTPKGGSLRPDFDRLLQLDFDHLISGHGNPYMGGARQAIAPQVEKLP